MPIFSTRFRATWVDTDAAGVVHFSNYFRYCERAEEEFLNSIGLDFQRIEKTYNLWFPRVSASCRYRWPIRFNQAVRVDLEEIEIGEKHVKYKYKVYNETEGRLSAECEVVVVAASREMGKAVKLPEDLVKRVCKALGGSVARERPDAQPQS